jgi:heat shock protein HslJ
MKRSIIIFLIAFSFIASAQSKDKYKEQLVGKDWVLSAVMGSPFKADMTLSALPFVHFSDDLKFTGNTSCNNFSGVYSTDKKDLLLDLGAMTRKACPVSVESQFLELIKKAKRFYFKKGNLVLQSDDVDELMTFKAR